MPLDRASILQKHGQDHIPRETVYVPDWGGEVVVRGLTPREHDRLEAKVGGKEPVGPGGLRAEIVVTCVVDEQGRNLFTAADELTLGVGPGRPVELVFDKAMELSGIGKKAREELEKNSAQARSGDSGSTSPSAGAAP